MQILWSYFDHLLHILTHLSNIDCLYYRTTLIKTIKYLRIVRYY